MATDDPDRAASVVGQGLSLLYLLPVLFYPFVPAISVDIASQIHAPLRTIPEQWTGEDLLPDTVSVSRSICFERLKRRRLRSGANGLVERIHKAMRKSPIPSFHQIPRGPSYQP